MGVLTENMTRLRLEAEALRAARRGLLVDLQGMTRSRRAEVREFRTRLLAARVEAAARTRSDLRAYVTHLRAEVSILRRGVREDLSASRRAWREATPAARQPGRDPEAPVVAAPIEEEEPAEYQAEDVAETESEGEEFEEASDETVEPRLERKVEATGRTLGKARKKKRNR